MNVDNESDSIYIKSKVNALSIYNTYWCLVELRSRLTIQQQDILKNDPLCKLKLIETLKKQKYNPKDLDRLLEISTNNSIPLSYVKWFYEDNRAAIWLNMVLKNRNILADNIYKESDISIFIHNLIFNKKILVTAKEVYEGTEGYNETLLYNKRLVLDLLETAYIRSKVPSKEMKWLNKHNTAQITHMYEYMQKVYDIDYIYLNKKNKKLGNQSYRKPDKSGYRQALICTDSINFGESNTTSRYQHMLASLDYWMFDTYWFDGEGIAVDAIKTVNRVTFIENMNAAWNSKTRRVRDRKTKDKGLDLNSTNKKILRLLAKKQDKTQIQMLNDIVASYCPESFNEVISKPKKMNKLSLGNYGKPYTDHFKMAESIEDKPTSTDFTSVDNRSNEIEDFRGDDQLFESVLDSVSAHILLDSHVDTSNDVLEATIDIARENIAHKGVSMTTNNESITKPNAHNAKYGLYTNFDRRSTNQRVDDKNDAFDKNAEIIRYMKLKNK